MPDGEKGVDMDARQIENLDRLVAELGDIAAYRDLDTSRAIMISIRVALGGARSTPKINRGIDEAEKAASRFDNYIANL